jgi:hypothetical protein
MKNLLKNSAFILLFAILATAATAQVAINTSGLPANSSAILDVESATKGMLVPRMKTSDMNAIVSPTNGLLIYNTTENAFYNFNGTSWTRLVSGSTGLLQDANKDTKVEVEKTANEDIIHFSTLGTEYFNMTHGRLNVLNTGNSVFIGNNAGANDDLLNRLNVFVGYSAGNSNTTGNNNTAVGSFAMVNNSTGRNNNAIGNNALLSNQGGKDNSAIGASALFFNTSGYSNMAIGTRALYNNVSGHNLVAVGDSALFNTGANAIGNVAIGSKTLYANTTGANNTSSGFEALKSNTVGSGNTANGFKALYANIGGGDNTAVGKTALGSNVSGVGNTAIGSEALTTSTDDFSNTALGARGMKMLSAGNHNTAVGADALSTIPSGSYNTAVGSMALYNSEAASGNTAIGFGALKINSTGSYNTAVGKDALSDNWEGEHNVAVGGSALSACPNGRGVVAVGDSALYGLIDSPPFLDQNTGVGYNSMHNTSDGWGNVALGCKSLVMNTTGDGNTAIGSSALYSNVAGVSNTAVGFQAMWASTSGSQNTMIGSDSHCAIGVNNATALGFNAYVPVSNRAVIGNTSVNSIGGYAGWTTFPSDRAFKRNVSENVPGLVFISKLRPVTYNVNVTAINESIMNELPGDKRTHAISAETDEIALKSIAEKEQVRYTGFIAQEVEEAARSVGYDFSGVDAPKNDKDYYGIRYAEFVVPLVKAVQEQQSEIQDYSGKIDRLEAQNAELMKMNIELLRRIEALENLK